ncbi:MAG: HAD family phosphatase [Lachnospiraceae bacterium]|nr:HAD family phosphatase [Lachnospiraceae bacterium]
MKKRNLIFDVGGVLIGYRWKEMFMEDFGLSEKEAVELAGRIFDDPMWPEFDRGSVEPEVVVEHYCTLYPDSAKHIKRLFYENDIMATGREAVWDRMSELKKKGYNIYILSNYSEYLFKKHTDHMLFRKIIDGGIVSYEVGAIKPEPGIYRKILEKYDLDPSECIFYDDIEKNVEAARAHGIESRLVTSEEDLLKKLDELES